MAFAIGGRPRGVASRRAQALSSTSNCAAVKKRRGGGASSRRAITERVSASNDGLDHLASTS